MANRASLSEIDLGPLNADRDTNLPNYYVPFGDFSDVLARRRFIVVGAKGTGKSALKKQLIATRSKAGQASVELDQSYGFHLSQIGIGSRAELENKVRGYLTAVSMHEILANNSLGDQSKKKKLQALQEEVPLIQRLVTPLKIKVPFLDYAIKDLFSTESRSQLLTITDRAFAEKVAEALGEDDLWILVDEVDRIFVSDESPDSLTLVEALISASSELNASHLAGKVFVVLLLRSEVYERLKRTFEDMDREEQYVWLLSWDRDELAKFLAERIRWALDITQDLPVWRYWAALFNCPKKADAEGIIDTICKLSINGPRDVLLLVSYAKELASQKGQSKIRHDDLRDSVFRYGQTKLQQLAANFQDQYEDIDRIADRVFRGKPQTFLRRDLEAELHKNLLTNNKALDAFPHSWVKTTTSFGLMQVLFQTGFLGYWHDAWKRYIFSIERPGITDEFSLAPRFQIHPAFHRYLETSDTGGNE